jgi:polyisoprenoid-binding protein YceI
MRTCFFGLSLVAFTLTLSASKAVRAADDYALDPMHSSVSFKIQHSGISWIHGRFNNVAGTFTIDPDEAASCSFALTSKVESIDTNNKKRDDHLRSPDFFNVKQFPLLSFKSTEVKAIKGGYKVTGKFTMHGVTKSITFTLTGGGKAEFPKGVKRTGYSTDLTLKRSDFGMDKGTPAIGDDVRISISFQGLKK